MTAFLIEGTGSRTTVQRGVTDSRCPLWPPAREQRIESTTPARGEAFSLAQKLYWAYFEGVILWGKGAPEIVFTADALNSPYILYRVMDGENPVVPAALPEGAVELLGKYERAAADESEEGDRAASKVAQRIRALPNRLKKNELVLILVAPQISLGDSPPVSARTGSGKAFSSGRMVYTPSYHALALYCDSAGELTRLRMPLNSGVNYYGQDITPRELSYLLQVDHPITSVKYLRPQVLPSGADPSEFVAKAMGEKNPVGWTSDVSGLFDLVWQALSKVDRPPEEDNRYAARIVPLVRKILASADKRSLSLDRRQL